MSQSVDGSDPPGGLELDGVLEAFESSREFHGPVESLDGHHCNEHFAQLYETDDERFETAVPFVRHGLERGERVIYVVDGDGDDAVKAALRDGGIDVDAALAAGQLSFPTVAETYLRDGSFDPDEMVEFYADTVSEATAEHEGLRIVAEMSWVGDDRVAFDEFAEYESKVNDLYDESDALTICQYDRTALEPAFLRDVVETHPHLIYDGAVCHNFYYTPPEEFLGTADPARELDRMLGTLHERTRATAALTAHQRFQTELYEITASNDRSFEEKLDALFELGREQFDIEFGFLNRVDADADRLEVEHASGEHDHYEVGEELPLSETYCQAAVDIEAAASVSNPEEDGLDDLRVYEDFGVDAYLGTYVPVDGDADRTLAFVPRETREESFSPQDRTIVELMGQWVGYELNRRQRERELRERTEHLNALVETTPECIKTVAEDGTLLQMNPAGLAMVEAEDESDVIGESVYDLIAPEDRDRYREFNERICDGDRDTLEFDVVGLEGTRRHMESHAAPLERPDGTTVQVGLTRDVTEQVERERELDETITELQESEERLRLALEAGEMGTWELDLTAGEAPVRSPQHDRIFGYEEPVDEWSFETFLDHVHPDDRERVAQSFETAVETGTWDFECRIVDANGERRAIAAQGDFYYDSDGDPDRAVGVVQDVSERKEHERYQRELYEIIADHDSTTDERLDRLLALGCERLDLPVGMVTLEREAAFEIEHMRGTHPDLDEGTLTPPLTDNYCRRVVDTGRSIAVADAGAAGWDEDALYHEFDLQCYAGTQIFVNGEAYGTLCFTDTEPRDRELTDTEMGFLDLVGQCASYELERKRHEQELEETISELRQSNERLKQFAYAASHDLQEPLRMVSTYLQLLENRYKDGLDEEATEYIEFAVDGADRMREMVDDLLAYSRVEHAEGDRQPVDCDAVVDRVTDDLQLQIEENDVAIAVESLPTVMADGEQVEQLFQNLLSNAIKYGGEEPPRIEIDAERRGDRWEFAVADNGIGIDPAKTDRIFEVFKRLHNDDRYAGTGIGLSLCQEIVENHDGDIWVESEPGEGSTFYFTLPPAERGHGDDR